MFEKKIEQFYKENKLNITITKRVDGLQLSTFFAKVNCYDTKTIKKIIKLQDTLCLYLQIDKINIKQDNKSGCIVFEIPSKERKFLTYKDLNKKYKKNNDGLYVNLGADTQNNIYNIDLCKTPHLLISGTTGSGKSVLVNSILTSLMFNYSPSELEIALVDIKQVEFSIYKNIPHLLLQPITTLEDTKILLENTIKDINKRYDILKDNNCRNIEEYNKKHNTKMKYRLIVIDELAELFMMENKTKLQASLQNYDRLETTICRIAQVGRASGVHLIVATQRPSTDVVSGLIKSNIPSRICLSVASATDSKIILDKVGAEKLLGKGDMFFKEIGKEDLIRLQGCFISDTEQLDFIEKIKNKYDGNNDITKEIESQKEEKEKNTLDTEHLDKMIEDNIRYTIENNTIYSYSEIKNQIYDYTNRDIFITQIAKTNKELDYLKSNYLKIANKLFSEYDKVYKNKEKMVIATTTKNEDKKLFGVGSYMFVGVIGALSGIFKAVKK